MNIVYIIETESKSAKQPGVLIAFSEKADAEAYNKDHGREQNDYKTCPIRRYTK